MAGAAAKGFEAATATGLTSGGWGETDLPLDLSVDFDDMLLALDDFLDSLPLIVPRKDLRLVLSSVSIM